ncbi:MAG TPA: ABC transporter ATP-binding protein [Actinocrinis sp.]|nr:ABC transporter ATP-binding protein [Actinocrinis sp.]
MRTREIVRRGQGTGAGARVVLAPGAPAQVDAGPDPVIRVRGLRKAYRDVVAVDGLDLDVRAGEVFALLGPNGAGKTTVTEILEGFRTADAGQVRVLGADPARAGQDWRIRIGVVLQAVGDFHEITVEEVLRHFAHYYPNPRRVPELIEEVGLADKRRTRTGLLSGGQRRRLDVALGLLGRPELLFLDEPTTGFDPAARRRFWDLIRGLRADGTTILLTTHYLEEAEQLADRVGVLSHGRLVDLDTPARLGGRQQALATVRWRDGRGAEHEQQTADPGAVVAALHGELGGALAELTVTRPTLEDIYLAMIGEQP